MNYYDLLEAFPYHWEDNSVEDDEEILDGVAKFSTPVGDINVFFSEIEPGEVDISFKMGDSYAQTKNNKHQHEIFKSIFNIIDGYLDYNHPDIITFDAAREELNQETGKFEPSNRARLYGKMINRLAKKYGYSASQDVAQKEVNFKLMSTSSYPDDNDPLEPIQSRHHR